MSAYNKASKLKPKKKGGTDMNGAEKEKKLIFVAHPVGNDLEGNKKKVIEICDMLFRQGVIPVAPYLVALQILNDKIPGERKLGIEANHACIARRFVDEVWLFGDRISDGMKGEILLAHEVGIPVIPMTEATAKEYVYFVQALGSTPRE
mgnify:FL=1